MTEVERCTDHHIWDDHVIERGGHPLQLWGWGAVKEAHSWQVERLFVKEGNEIIGMAQVLVRRLPGPLKALGYIPRGPVCKNDDREEVLEALATHIKSTFGAVALTIEPDWEEAVQVEGWQPSANQVLIPRTLILDLTKTEEELLGSMTKKTRQYIRKSEKDVVIRQIKDREGLEKCLAIYKQTAARAGFALHAEEYYYDVFDKLGDHSPVFAAFKDEELVAFLWLAISGETAFELYGGMNETGQETRANYALKWHTVQTMKKWGIHRYDMNGLLNDGVSTFKQGFADHENMLAGTYDRPLSSLYIVWSKGFPLAKKVIRKLKSR